MKKIYKSMFVLLIAGLVSSCTDYLTQPPYDSTTDGEYWQTEDHIRTYCHQLYPVYFAGYGASGILGGTFGAALGSTDDVADNVQSEFTPIRIPETDGSWTFTNIRKANYIIQSVDRMQDEGLLSLETYNHWMGVARLFRAMAYSSLTFQYGDVPWFDHVLSSTEYDQLYKDRDPRLEVDEKILADYKFAVENIRTNDGVLQINRYVAAGMAARYMLREATFLKYHNISQEKAQEYLAFVKQACLVAMDGPYKVADNYNSLFSSDDLSGNTEVLMYRKYAEGILMHSTLSYNNTEAQTGASKDLLYSYLDADGLPVQLTAGYNPKTAEEFFKDRDPRLTATFRPAYYIRGDKTAPFSYSTSGYSCRKFMDESEAGSTATKFALHQNITDAPCLRLGEVLVTYAEACYELGSLTQKDLDISINLLRSRAGMELPNLQVIGGQPAVNNQVYDDPTRDPDVPAMLWEIRRERRIELYAEGLRLNDLKRWKKLDYMYNGANPDIRYGAYIRYADYPDANKTEVQIENGASEGFILCNRGTQRQAPQDKHYVKPVPKQQIQLYKDHGYTLSQTKAWENEE